jgi:hypothetical protein
VFILAFTGYIGRTAAYVDMPAAALLKGWILAL